MRARASSPLPGVVEVAGDELVDYLERTWQPGTEVHVVPPTRDWTALKPEVWRLLAARRAQGAPLPRLVGYPRCAFGGDHLELETALGPPREAPPPCAACAQRTSCSPPLAWSEALQPFSGQAPLALFSAFSARHAEVTGSPFDAPLAAILAAHLDAGFAVTRRNPVTLEPSLLVGKEGVAPVLRLAVFHGPPLPGQPGIERTTRLLDSYRRMHEAAGARLPEGLLEALAPHAPFAFPVGFEAAPGRPLLLKAYVEWQDQAPSERRALAEALAEQAGCPLPPIADWSQVELMGLGTAEGRLASLKLYVRGVPTAGGPGLPALPASHPLVRLSEGQAYAVLDALHVEARAPKWDFSVRRQLLPGTLLSRQLGPLLSQVAGAEVDTIVRHHAFRADTVAIGLREDRLALYLDLA